MSIEFGFESNHRQQGEFLYLTTIGWKTSNKHQIEIWFILHDNKKYYVMSEGWEQSMDLEFVQKTGRIRTRIAVEKLNLSRIVNSLYESEFSYATNFIEVMIER